MRPLQALLLLSSAVADVSAIALPNPFHKLSRTDAAGSSSSKFVPGSVEATSRIAAEGLAKLALHQQKNPSKSSCTLENAVVRREWSDLSLSERREFIDAQLCLMSSPAKDRIFAPGARTRFDDVVALHMNQSLSIHGTANFLSWHRWYTYTWEQALRNECGYKGYQPYWNWGKYAHDPIGSPLFDGSDYSLSGTGAYVEHDCSNATHNALSCIPPNGGGGCVYSGPFKDMVVNLGPVAPVLPVPGVIDSAVPTNSNILERNYPRCLRRDISPYMSQGWTKDSDAYDLLTNYNDIGSFQNHMQGNSTLGFYGVHGGGHYTVVGDPGGDFYMSSGDPAFFLHHAQIDRIWWIWQNQDLGTRQFAFEGGTSLRDPVHSPRGSLDDPIVMGSIGYDVKNRDVMSTTDGPLCYIYL